MFSNLLGIINALLLPAGGLTPISIVAWFGLLGGPLTFALGFLYRLISRGKK